MGKPGFGWTTSSPGFTSAVITKYMMGLAPGVTTTSSVDTGMLRAPSTSLTIASRSGEARGRPVVGRPAVERPLRRLADVGRRVEVRLSDLEVDDLLALPLEGLRARQDLEGRFRAEPRHPIREVHGGADYNRSIPGSSF